MQWKGYTWPDAGRKEPSLQDVYIYGLPGNSYSWRTSKIKRQLRSHYQPKQCQVVILCRFRCFVMAFLVTVPLAWNWLHNLGTTLSAIGNHQATSIYDWPTSRLPTNSLSQGIIITIMRTHFHCKQAKLFIIIQYSQNCRQKYPMLKRSSSSSSANTNSKPLHFLNQRLILYYLFFKIYIL